jgi:hypothetical protein
LLLKNPGCKVGVFCQPNIRYSSCVLMAESYESKVAGVLRLEPHFGDSWEAVASLAVPFFGGKRVPVTFHCGTEPDFAFLLSGDAVLINFLGLGEVEQLESAATLMSNYHQNLDDDGGTLLLNYPSDLWHYVDPRHLHLMDGGEGTQRDLYVMVEGECEWEPEHGLQLVFRQGRMLTRASQYDGYLTQRDAEEIPEEQDALMQRYYAKFGHSAKQ